MVTESTLNAQNPQILDAAVENIVATATWGAVLRESDWPRKLILDTFRRYAATSLT
jgi:hypothetical protein